MFKRKHPILLWSNKNSYPYKNSKRQYNSLYNPNIPGFFCCKKSQPPSDPAFFLQSLATPNHWSSHQLETKCNQVSHTWRRKKQTHGVWTYVPGHPGSVAKKGLYIYILYILYIYYIYYIYMFFSYEFPELKISNTPVFFLEVGYFGSGPPPSLTVTTQRHSLAGKEAVLLVGRHHEIIWLFT